MATTNIKQLTNRTVPQLTDFLYTVAGDTDYNVTLDAIKELFGIEDTELWQNKTLTANNTTYLNVGSATDYASFKIEYVIKREDDSGTTKYRSGMLSVGTGGTGDDIFDDSDRALVSDVFDFYVDDAVGVLADEGVISSGTFQIKFTTDNSYTADAVLNYKIVHKKPITVVDR